MKCGVVGEEEEMERCMHCFRDFPLREMVEHSSSCLGDALGERDRFQNFIPSVHDVSSHDWCIVLGAVKRAR